jgi:hypothetical protein
MNEPLASPARPAADWAKAADGIGLAGMSVFLLMNTMGRLPWSFWLDAISLWPVLLMSAGIKIAFEKSRAPWLVLVGPVLVLGSLAWLASAGRPDLPLPPGESRVLERPAGVSMADVEVSLANGQLRLSLAHDLPADRLVDGRSAVQREKSRFEVDAAGETARVRLGSGRPHGFVFLPRSRERWDLRLPSELPVRVRLSGAAVGADVDLTGGTPQGVIAKGVFLGVSARLPAPRADTTVRMEGAFNALTVTVPEGTPVRVHGPGLPLNAKGRGLRGTPGRPGYDVRLEGAFSAVEVRTDRSLPTEPPPGPAPPPQAPVPAEAPPARDAPPPAEAAPGR